MRHLATTAVIALLALAITLAAQTKPAATFADFGQWETLAPAGARGGFSPDGHWLAYAINRSNRNNELRILKIADGTTKVAAFGAQPAWSSDSKWIAYSIGLHETEQEKLRSEQKPVQNKLGLLNLATGETTTFDAIESFAFGPDGAHLVLRPYGPERPSGAANAPAGGGRGGARGGGADTSAEDTPGTTLIVRDLRTGRDTTFGNVSQFAWQDAERSHLLAMIISAPGKTGNGVHLFDAEANTLRVLDSAPAFYTGLAWRKDAPDLAVLRAKTDDKKEGSTYSVLAWSGLGSGKSESLRTYDPAADSSFPAGMRTVSFRRLSWSDDGGVVFVGMAKWDDKIAPGEKGDESSAGGGARRGGRGGAAGGRPNGAAAAAPDEPAALEIWHWSDAIVMPKQKVDASGDRRRNTLAAWHLDSGKLVRLGNDPVNEQVTPIRHTGLAYVAEWSKYAMNRSIGRPGADLYLQDIATGARTKLRDGIIDRFVQAGPAGKYLLFLQDDQYWTVNLATRTLTNITRTVPTSFVDKESDQTTKQKPPHGVAGWTKDDAAVLLYDKFDIWQVATDGSGARRLTTGAAEQVRHRLVRVDPDEEAIDLAKPQYVSLYGEWTKKSGLGRLEPGGAVTRLVWLDKSVGPLAKAKDAEVYAYIAQNFDDSPDIFVAGPDLKDAKQATTTNPFQANCAWGHSELLDYKLASGKAMQGALYYPAGYEAGRQYPMIVYMYEKLSQNVHRYVVPSDRDYYNIAVFTSLGYFVFEPDIVFTPRQPGVSVVQCVVPGVKRVLQTGMVDPKRVGAVGHSWGGFDAAFLATNTTGVFAAAVAGAPLTDLVSMYGDHHWGPGIAETDHIETGQERMEVPLWEDLPDYVTNSALFTVNKMSVPLLLEEGDADGTVFWHQSVELYNAARRIGKNVVFLVYNGEDHGLRQRKNQTDYQRRILAWFGHYLKGEPAESWITNGESFLDRDAEVKRATSKK
jgi:dipeptidyl aminopeptidase/acylaminoacyl peptidase